MNFRRVSVISWLFLILLLPGAGAVSAGECPLAGSDYATGYRSTAGRMVTR